MIYLIGAGPGDPGLLTLRGAECIKQADVLVYDRLSSDSLLALARPEAQLIYVGKTPGQRSKTQEEINDILVDLGLQGKNVARVKGGDPFVFGRGGEEALALREYGLPFTIVPGVTSAIAAPAYAGVPVTHRELSRSFHVITGHADTAGEIDFATLARVEGTLLFLMSMSNLPLICQRLLAEGRDPATPAAVVQQGTTGAQRQVSGTLADIVALVAAAGVTNPAVIVIGAVAELTAQLSWFGRRPLHGKRVAVTRARSQSAELSEKLRALGAEVVEFPLLRFAPDAEQLATAVADPAQLLAFTSVNGVRCYFDYLRDSGADIRSLAGAQLYAIGPGTARALRQRGLFCCAVPDKFTGAELAALIALETPPQRIKLLRSDLSSRRTAQLLEQSGFTVADYAVYRTLADGQGAENFAQLDKAGEIDYITFTSSSTVQFFHRLRQGEPPRAQVVCIGEVTAQTARELGLSVAAQAGDYTIDGVTAALLELAQAGDNR